MSLIIENVSKTFEDSKEDALYKINLEIKDGEFVCVVGQSGCGKSTLLNLIAGLLEPTEGRILLNGEVVSGPGADRVVMFQEHALFPWLNVMQNVEFGMKLAGIAQSEREETAAKYLEMMGLLDYRENAIHQLSGGQRQRVALARALTMNSKILLMDEPFSALDKQTSNRLRAELKDIWQKTGRTILFITHSVEEAVYLADRIVVMSPVTHSIAEVVSVELERPRHVYDGTFMNYRHKILGMVQGEAKA